MTVYVTNVTHNLICRIAPYLPNISYISSVEISKGRFLYNKTKTLLIKKVKCACASTLTSHIVFCSLQEVTESKKRDTLVYGQT